METMPSIRDLWDFNDLPASERRFREWIERVPPTNPLHYELQTQLARTYSLRKQFDEAHAVLETVAEHVDSAPSVRVRYLLERGRTHNSARDAIVALPLFEAAWQAAIDAGLEALALDAAHMLAIADPDVEKQIAWSRKAIALMAQSDTPDVTRWYGALHNNLGWTFHGVARYDEALTTFQQALAWFSEHGSTQSIHQAHYAVARTLRSLARHQEAMDRLQLVLAEQAKAETDSGFIHEELAENWLALDQPDKAQVHFAHVYDLLKDVDWIDAARLARIQQQATL